MFEYIRWLYRIVQSEVLEIPGRIIALLFVISLLIMPLIADNSYMFRILILAAIFTIFAVSWDILSGFTGQINFGQGLFFGVAAYSSGLLNIHFSLPPWLTIPIGSIVAVLVGLLVGVPALRLRGFYFGLVTLAFPVVLSGIVLIFPDFTGGELGIYGLNSLSPSILSNYYIVTLIMLVSVYIMYKFSDAESRIWRIGVIIHAIREDEIAARISGIDTTKYKLLTFAVSGFFAGIAGGLYCHYLRIVGPSTLELFFSLQPILWTIFGGIATIYGAVAGVYLLFPLTELMSLFEAGEKVRFLLFSLILIFTLLFMPEGITVWVRDKIEVKCQRCKTVNNTLRRQCRACQALLHLEEKYLSDKKEAS